MSHFLAAQVGGVLIGLGFIASEKVKSHIPNMLDALLDTDFHTKARNRIIEVRHLPENRVYRLLNGAAPPPRDREFPKWA